MDTAKPVMKIYSGKNVKACLNLTIFNPDYVFTQEMFGNTKTVYTKAQEYVTSMQESLEQYNKTVERLKGQIYKGTDLNELTGSLLRQSMRNTKLGHTVVIQAVREIDNPKSTYYARNGEISGWQYYNAITEFIGNADILDRPTKTLILSDIFLERYKQN